MTRLDQLLERKEHATPGERIELRDSIAAHGTDALPGLSSWLEGDHLGFFAARVIERIAKEYREPALRALRDARDGVPATVAREIDAIIERLDPPRRPATTRRPVRPREPRTWPSRRLGHPYGEAGSYRVLNTSHHNNHLDDSYMLGEHRAAAFFDTKRRIETIEPGDIVFLYRNGEGIVAMGQAAGPLRRRAYQGIPEHPEEEFFRELEPFQRVVPPASAGEIKDVTGHTYSFRGTLFILGVDEGERLLLHLTGG